MLEIDTYLRRLFHVIHTRISVQPSIDMNELCIKLLYAYHIYAMAELICLCDIPFENVFITRSKSTWIYFASKGAVSRRRARSTAIAVPLVLHATHAPFTAYTPFTAAPGDLQWTICASNHPCIVYKLIMSFSCFIFIIIQLLTQFVIRVYSEESQVQMVFRGGYLAMY